MPAEASTLHRLLGARPGFGLLPPRSRQPAGARRARRRRGVDGRPRAHGEARSKRCRARARLILLGDKDQLASVEAGAVLGDICGARRRLRARSRSASPPRPASPRNEDPASANVASPLADSVALLDTSYRFGPESGIGTLARLVNAGQGAEALALLEAGDHADIAWRAIAPGELRDAARGQRRRTRCAAISRRCGRTRRRRRSSRASTAFRVLCAHRRGPFGVDGAQSA